MKRILIALAALLLVATTEAQGILPPQAKEGKTITIDKADFFKYIYNYEKNPSAWSYEGSLPCIIDFYADWCGPCRRLAPILSEVAKEYRGKLVVYKVNTDKEQELAAYFGIQSLPTIVFVPKDGKPRGIMGLVPKEELERIISELFGIEAEQTVEI
jgi:thioredoxin